MTPSGRALPRAITVLPQWIPALDGLRGLAILFVLFAHFGEKLDTHKFLQHIFRSLFDFGGTGVDLFFVLSGFLITGILLDSRDTEKYFSVFYMRRFLRIFPLYYFALVFVFGIVLPLEQIPIHNHAIWYFLYVQNWTSNSVHHLGHFWSLAIEEQFYFIWPLAVWAAGRRRVFQIAVACSLFSVGLRFFLTAHHVDVALIHQNLFTRMDALLIGAACACIIRDGQSFRRVAVARWLGLLPLLTLPLLRVASNAAGDRFVVNQGVGYTLIALSYAGLLLSLVSTLGERTLEQRFFSSSAMRWIGKYSYGAYVWHQLVQHGVELAERALQIRLAWFVQIPLLMAATALVSVCSYMILEQPFLALKRYFEPRQVVRVPAAVLVNETAGNDQLIDLKSRTDSTVVSIGSEQ